MGQCWYIIWSQELMLEFTPCVVWFTFWRPYDGICLPWQYPTELVYCPESSLGTTRSLLPPSFSGNYQPLRCMYGFALSRMSRTGDPCTTRVWTVWVYLSIGIFQQVQHDTGKISSSWFSFYVVRKQYIVRIMYKHMLIDCWGYWEGFPSAAHY